jgi:hypothetical protein
MTIATFSGMPLPRLLGTALAGHLLVKAIKRGGNVDEAIREFEQNAPTPERIEEYIKRAVNVAASEVEKLALQLCSLIDRDDGKQRQKTGQSLNSNGLH